MTVLTGCFFSQEKESKLFTIGNADIILNKDLASYRTYMKTKGMDMTYENSTPHDKDGLKLYRIAGRNDSFFYFLSLYFKEDQFPKKKERKDKESKLKAASIVICFFKDKYSTSLEYTIRKSITGNEAYLQKDIDLKFQKEKISDPRYEQEIQFLVVHKDASEYSLKFY